jgi:hypothetical protein
VVTLTRALRVTLLPAMALLSPTTAEAQLDFTFVAAPPVLSGTRGSTLSFFARLNNTSGAPITLQGFNPGLTALGLTADDLFFDNVPDPLPAGPGPIGGYNIFDVVISATAVPGTYTGTAVIDYDAVTGAGWSVSHSYSVQVLATAVPEPGTWWLLAPGVLLLRGALRHRKRDHRVSPQG